MSRKLTDKKLQKLQKQTDKPKHTNNLAYRQTGKLTNKRTNKKTIRKTN